VTYPGYILGMQTAVSGISRETLALAPSNEEEVASILRFASETHKTVDVRGGGTHHGFGSPPTPDIVLSMEKFDRIEAWDPDDLTVVVGAGIQIQELEAALAERAEQREVLPHLRRRGGAAVRQLLRRHGRHAPLVTFLEEAQVQRQAADGGVGDPSHGVL